MLFRSCAEYTEHVQHAIQKLSGVESVNVLLASEKAIIRPDPDKVDMLAIRKAVASVGAVIQTNVNELVAHRYNISHATLQLECVGCDPDALYCDINGVVHKHEHA